MRHRHRIAFAPGRASGPRFALDGDGIGSHVARYGLTHPHSHDLAAGAFTNSDVTHHEAGAIPSAGSAR